MQVLLRLCQPHTDASGLELQVPLHLESQAVLPVQREQLSTL